MPITLTIGNQLAPKIWELTGSINLTDQKLEGDVSVIAKQTDDNHLQLFLDSGVHKSTIANREVALYTRAQPTQVDKIAKGKKATFTFFWFTLKKDDNLSSNKKK